MAPDWTPITITRVNANLYIVGRIHLVRQENGSWEARPYGSTTERPLFTANTLEEILDMAHGAAEMMRPA